MSEPQASSARGAASAATIAMIHLATASYAIAGATSQEELASVLRKSVEHAGADSYYLCRLSHGGEEAEILAAWARTPAQSVSVGARFARADLPALGLLAPDAPFSSDDGPADARFEESTRQRILAEGARSIGLYPLVRGGELAGALVVIYRTPHVHTAEDRAFFSVVAQLASAALAGIEGREDLAKQVKRANAMHRAAEKVSNFGDEESVWTGAARLLIDEIGFADVWFGLVDEEAGVVRERAHGGVGAYPGRAPTVYPLDDPRGAPAKVVRTGQPSIDLDVRARAEAEGWGDVVRKGNLRTVIVVPLRAGGTMLGALAVARTEERVSEDDVAMLSTFASQLATTVLRARADGARQRQVRSLEEAYANQERLLATVRELSTPVIPVHDGILVVPLVGTLDSTRSAQVMEALLAAIQRDRAAVVILDITGVPTVDTGVANQLLRATRAAGLLGARCILVGMSPVVAQTVVQLGVDLGCLATRNNLQAGIAYALSLRGLEILPAGERR